MSSTELHTAWEDNEWKSPVSLSLLPGFLFSLEEVQSSLLFCFPEIGILTRRRSQSPRLEWLETPQMGPVWQEMRMGAERGSPDQIPRTKLWSSWNTPFCKFTCYCIWQELWATHSPPPPQSHRLPSCISLTSQMPFTYPSLPLLLWLLVSHHTSGGLLYSFTYRQPSWSSTSNSLAFVSLVARTTDRNLGTPSRKTLIVF